MLCHQVKSLAERARAGKLKPNEFQGGTFRSVSCFTLHAGKWEKVSSV
jgi:pyruvate/2-oxoglutarate dehydrogenase complex dihydrolipoamide acyltransferase (E2) component